MPDLQAIAEITSCGHAALAYAARGWHVFPCRPGGKEPLGKLAPHGVKDATTDPEQIRRWWTACPDANVGVACGKSALVVVDCDGAEGVATFAAWAEANDVALGDVPCAATPRGGRHYYFAAPAGAALGPKVRVLPGVDVRAGESYVVAPPSRWNGKQKGDENLQPGTDVG